MADSREFHLFPKLPTEMRRMIWAAVPRPKRIITMLSPRETWYANNMGSVSGALLDWDGRPNRAWDFRYVVQPREATIFAPLHVNREARSIWLHKYTRPEKHETTVETAKRSAKLIYNTPFIDYDNDIFTVVHYWIPIAYMDMKPDSQMPDTDKSYFNAFPGLDRSRIKHAGVTEVTRREHLMVLSLDITTMPKLKTLSVVSIGPDYRVYEILRSQMRVSECDAASARAKHTYKFPHQQMPGVDLTMVDCEVFDLDDGVVEDHVFFNNRRLQYPGTAMQYLGKLSQFTVLLKAWIWHMSIVEIGANYELDTEMMFDTWQYFLPYLLSADEEGELAYCPLPASFCTSRIHSREDCLDWKPRFDIKYVFLCHKMWVEDFENLGVLDGAGPSYLNE